MFPAVNGIPGDAISAFADLGYNLVGTDTEAMITEFQLEQKVIDSKDDPGAGTYGPKTKAALAKLHAEYTVKRNQELQAIAEARKLLLTDHDKWKEKYTKAESHVTTFGQPRIKDTNEGIRNLQSWLAK